MSADKKTSNQQTNATTTPTAPAYVDQYNQAEVDKANRQRPELEALQNTGVQAAQNVYNAFANNTPLTGYLAQLQGITPEQTTSMVNEALRYADPNAQQGGVLNSGAYDAIRARTAAQIGNQNAQFNVGALQNLLNLANTGQAQVQQPINAASAVTSSRLSGLNSVNAQGLSNGASYQQNPFLNSFETGLGNTFGNATGTASSAFLFCWVASELFNEDMFSERVCAVRRFIREKMPKWFVLGYIKYGEKIAKFIHNKPIIKFILRPIFSYFAKKGGYNA